MVELGVPVQELSSLEMLTRARRLKQQYASDEVSHIQALRDQVEPELDRLRIHYTAGTEGGAP
jgi:hypothetical protein